MIIIGSDNRYLFRKFGDRLFDLDPKVSTPVANSAGNLEFIDDFSASNADLDSTDAGLGTETAYDFDENINDQVGALDAIKKYLQWHTGESRSEVELYCGANRIIEVPTFMFDTISNQVSITFKIRSGATFGLEDNRLFHAARKSDIGSILEAQVADNTNTLRFITGSQVGDINTTNDLSISNTVGGEEEVTTWTFTKNVTSGEMKIYKKGRLVASSLTNTLNMAGIERFVLGGTFNSKYWRGRIGLFRLDNEELTPEVIYHLANPTIAYQDWPMVDFSTMTITTLVGGAETGTATVLGTKIGMELSGEARRAIDLGVSNYNIGYNTYLEFDFQSDTEGDQHAIAILNSDGSTDWTKAFQLFGTVTTQGNQAYNDYQLSDGVKHYKIQLGKELGIDLLNHGIIGLINTGVGDSKFYNVRIREIVTLNPLNTTVNVNLTEWTPDIIQTIAWWDAANTSTITHDGSNNVIQVDDIGTNANIPLTVASVSNRPITNTRTLNGLNVLDCIEGLYLQNMDFPMPVSGNITLIGVLAIDVVNATNDSIWSFDTGTDFQCQANNSTQFNGAVVGGGVSNQTFTGGPFSGPVIASNVFNWNDGRVRSYFNGNNVGDTSYSTKLTSGSQYLRFMSNRGASNKLDGAFAEVIAIEDCDETTRQYIEGYLAHKWGLTANLPSGHPYKTNPPMHGEMGASPSITIDEQLDAFFDIDHTVTSDTKLELTVTGSLEPDLLIVGIQNQDNGYEVTNHNFKLWGTNATPVDVVDAYDDYVGSNIPKLYSIPIGAYFTGTQLYARINVETLSTTLGLNIANMVLIEPHLIPQDDDVSSLVVYNFNETEGGKITDSSGNDNHGLILNGDTDNPYAGRIINFNSRLPTYPQTQPSYPDVLTNLVRRVSFDETLTGKFIELLANSTIYTLGSTYPSRVVSPSGHAIYLNGVNQWLSMNYTLPLTNASVSLWFKTSASGTMTLFTSGVGQQLTSSGRYIDLINGNISASLNGEVITSTGLTLNDDQWHHVLYSYGSAVSGQKLFVDGVQVASGVQTTSVSVTHDYVGVGCRNSGSNDYTGLIDDLRIYNQAYTSIEALKIVAAYGTIVISEKARSLKLLKNTWYNVALSSNITITPNTVLEFDFESTVEGEVQGLGFSTVTDPTTFTNIFKLFGTEASGILDYDNYQLVDGVKHYKLPIGQFYTGSFGYLTFVCDDDLSVDTPNVTFSNIQIYEEKEVYVATEGSSSAIALNGAEILEVPGHPNIQGLDHCFVFGIKTISKNATIMKRGGFDGDGYELRIDDSGYLVVSYTVFPTTYDLTFTSVINDDVLHRIVVHLDNTNLIVNVCVDGELLSQVLPNVLIDEPTGPFFIGGHDGYHPDSAHYISPKTLDGYLDFIKINSDNVSLLKAMSMAQRTISLQNSIEFLEGYSPILFTEGNVPNESYGTIILAVKAIAPITSKITLLSGVDPDTSKINLRSSSGAVIGFERSGVSEYNSSFTISEDEVMVIAVTSISGENQVYISKNLSGRETVATTADYKLPTQVIGELGPFELIRIVGYSTPLTEVEERYLIRQIMKHPNVGLL